MEAEPPTDTSCPKDPPAGADPQETAELPGEDNGAAEVLVSRAVPGPPLRVWGSLSPAVTAPACGLPASSSRRALVLLRGPLPPASVGACGALPPDGERQRPDSAASLVPHPRGARPQRLGRTRRGVD